MTVVNLSFTQSKKDANGVCNVHVENGNSRIGTMDDYDPFEHIKTENSTSYFGTMLHVLALSLSPAILSLPFTFVKTGYIVGFFGSLTIILFYLYCMRSIVTTEYTLCKRLKVPQMTYAETIYYAFKTGPTCCQKFAYGSQYIVDGNFVLTWVGANSVLVLLASKNLKTIVDYFYQTDLTIRTIIIIVFIPLVLLCCIPNLKYLIPCSIFANVINLGCIFVILYFVLQDIPPITSLKKCGDFSSFPLFVATILFTINITGIIMPLKNEMRSPKLFNSKFGVVNIFYFPFTILYSSFGLVCYLKYGDKVKESVIWNLPGSTWSEILIGMYGIGICFFFPLNSYVPAEIIWDWIARNYHSLSERRIFYSTLVRASVAAFTILVAFATPNVALFLSFTGTVGTAIDTMILPAIAEVLVNVNDRKIYLFVKNILIIFLGFILILIGTYDGINQFLKYIS